MSKKINAALKKAYYYFGFNEVVSIDEVKQNIEILKNNTSDESVLNKINNHESEIVEFCDFVSEKDDFTFPVGFAKDEPRKSWEFYTEDFPEDVFENNVSSTEDSGDIEPVEDEGDIVSVEDDVVEDDGDIVPAPQESNIKPIPPKSNKTKNTHSSVYFSIVN